ncbi:MAG: tetratricopeptide repeat protein [Magnetococcales bacterium]|nr:tetratricopeptide repeat protein [Magnetococcales bacterium]
MSGENLNSALNPSLLFREAAEAHQQGLLEQAEKAYRKVLTLQPTHAQALNNLAVLLESWGRFEEALPLMVKAQTLRPEDAEPLNNLGSLYLRMGRIKESADALTRALTLRPHYTEALHNLGALMERMGRFDLALDAYRQALALTPQDAELYNNIGSLLLKMQQTALAVSSFQEAVQLNPSLLPAWSNLGITLGKLKQHAAAVEANRVAVQLAPRAPAFHLLLGEALFAADRLEEAIAVFQETLALLPKNPVDAESRDLAKETHHNLGVTLLELGQFEAGMRSLRRALGFDAEYQPAQLALALALLATGRFTEGWERFEYRITTPGPDGKARVFPQPIWKGEPLAGRTLLVATEQGFGDMLQLARFMPMLAARGGRVVLEVPIGLLTLLHDLPGTVQVVAYGTPLPEFDLWIPALSLLRVLGIEDRDLPAAGGYITAPAPLEPPLPREGVKALIGLCWQGNTDHARDQYRSIPFASLEPLLALPGLRFVSLQVGPGSEAPGNHPWAESMLRPALPDFAATARVVAQLDLVITPDTSPAHLAGAMGRPVWTLLSYVPDWRWRLSGESTPWYASMRLFRQAQRNDWPELVQRVVAALQERFP